MRYIVLVIGLACAVLAAASGADLIGLADLGLTTRNLLIGGVGFFFSWYSYNLIKHTEDKEKERSGPFLR